MARTSLKGDKELIRALGRMPNTIRASIDPIAKEALEPLRDQTEKNARMRRQPGKTPSGGHLDQNIVTAKKSGGSTGLRVFWVSLRRRARSIGHLVEFGTAPHFQPRRGMMHPGARPFPFMTPAYEQEKNNVVSRVATLTWSVISRGIRGVARR